MSDPLDQPEKDEQEDNRAGGYRYDYTPETLKEERQVAKDFMRQVGKQVLSGNLAYVSMPVRVFEPRSFLERLADNWLHFPELMANAARCHGQPLERMKWVVAAALSGLHHNIVPKKPFNPILGETYQARFEDGSHIYCEQTSHHPPVSHYEVVPADGSYYFYGYGMYAASFSVNTVRGKQNGPNIVTFPDGTKIMFNLPGLSLRGVLWGDRVLNYEGKMVFVDRTNRLKCELQLDPDKKGWFKSFVKKQETPSDTVRGEIFQVEDASELEYEDDDDTLAEAPAGEDKKKKDKKKKDSGKSICKVEGSWLTHVQFQENKGEMKRYWDTKQSKVFRPIPVENPLPSDCRFRADLVALKSGDVVDAQKKKEELEQIQRRDRDLRKEGSKHKK